MRRKNRFGQYFIVCLLLLCCVTTVADALPPEWDRVLDSTVFIETDVGRGSGFFVGSDRVATCYHIIAGASRGQVKTESKYFNIARVTKYDSTRDLAILRVEEDPISRRFDRESPSRLPFGQKISGENVYVMGYPRGEGLVNKVGKISGSTNICGEHEFNITAEIVPGSNGGPVLNMNAEVIGIAIRGTPRNSAVHVKYLNRLSEWKGQGAFPPLDVYNIDPCVLISLVNMKLEMGAYDSVTEYIERFDDDRLDPVKKQQLKQQLRKAAQKGNKLTKRETLRLLAKWLRLVL